MLQRFKKKLFYCYWILTRRNLIVVDFDIINHADDSQTIEVQTSTLSYFKKDAHVFVLEKAIEQIQQQRSFV